MIFWYRLLRFTNKKINNNIFTYRQKQLITRNVNNIYLSLPRTNNVKKTITYERVQLFNKLPKSVKQTKLLNIFRKPLINHIFSDQF